MSKKPVSEPRVTFRVTPEEKASLEAAAKAEGVSLASFVYCRALGRPLSRRPLGRIPRQPRTQDEQLFDKTG